MSVLINNPYTSSSGSSGSSSSGSGGGGGSDTILLVKGAAELLLHRCTYYHSTTTNTILPLLPQHRAQILSRVQELAGLPLRMICCGVKYSDVNMLLSKYSSGSGSGSSGGGGGDGNGGDDIISLFQKIPSSQYINMESELVLVGVCGIVDPLRVEVKVSVV